jgi:hypothetical protein
MAPDVLRLKVVGLWSSWFLPAPGHPCSRSSVTAAYVWPGLLVRSTFAPISARKRIV